MVSTSTQKVSFDVVIPVLNEAHVLASSVATLRKFLIENMAAYCWSVVIVDNGSKDGTDEVGRELAAQYSDVIFLRLDQRGRGRALRHAWMHSQADIVSYMDVDLSTSLTHVREVVTALLDEGCDIAIGSRLMRASRTRRSLKREVISRLYNIFLKAVLWTRFSDAQCGFKAATREVVEKIVPQIKDQSWFFDTEMLVLAEKQGYRIKDIPVVWNEDDDSRVKIISTAWEDIKGVFRVRRLLWSREFAQAAGLHGKRAAS
jgi:glycosyltransferase involved in cell wall biosynthesis